jgi:predicted metal-dependent hydrolase
MNLFRPQRYADGDRLDVRGCAVRLKVDGRARRISLRVDRAKSEVVALAPTPRRLSEAVAFAHEKADWIAGQLAALPDPPGHRPRRHPAPAGQALSAGGRSRPAEDDRRALIAPDDSTWSLKIIRLAKREALTRLTERTAHHAAALNRPMPSVAIADPKARWGSCRPARPGHPAAIRYSWRLVLAPFEVADYVVAHECAHLIEANHGPEVLGAMRGAVGRSRARTGAGCGPTRRSCTRSRRRKVGAL